MMTSRLLARGAVALIAAAVFASSAFAQGAGGVALPTNAVNGNEVHNVQSGTSPVINTMTTKQIVGYGNTLPGDNGFRNTLVGGDFATNPWQRGTSFAAIANTLTYTADRFWALGGASSSITVSKQTGASDIPAGFGASLRLQRANANTDTTAICVGQVLESKNSLQFQGQNGVLSFWALSGANFSAASGNVNVTVGTGTGTDQSAANFAAGTWTGFSSLTLTPNQGTQAAGAGIAQPVTSTWTRYSFSFPVTATATQIGVKICFTPVGTAGANDWVELEGVQLEVSPLGTPSAFDQVPAAIVLLQAQRYALVINEPANGINVAMGQATTATNANIVIPFPDTMRVAPTITTTLGTWKVTVAAGTQQACTALAAGTGHSAIVANLSCTVAANLVAGNATSLQGAGGAGVITAASEL